MRPIHFLLFGVLLVLPSPVDAQNPAKGAGKGDPRLRIDSPRDGAVVAPGEILQVTVSSPNRTRFLGTQSRARPRCLRKFAIEIPKSIKLGVYSVSAVAGRAGQDGGLVVAVIEVDIERHEMPHAITPVGRQVEFRKKGQTSGIELVGDFGKR